MVQGYTVTITTTIQEKMDDTQYVPASYLNYTNKFDIQGNSFTEIAPTIDRIVNTVKGITENE